MSREQYYIGTTGPYFFDPLDLRPDGSSQAAFSVGGLRSGTDRVDLISGRTNNKTSSVGEIVAQVDNATGILEVSKGTSEPFDVDAVKQSNRTNQVGWVLLDTSFGSGYIFLGDETSPIEPAVSDPSSPSSSSPSVSNITGVSDAQASPSVTISASTISLANVTNFSEVNSRLNTIETEFNKAVSDLQDLQSAVQALVGVEVPDRSELNSELQTASNNDSILSSEIGNSVSDIYSLRSTIISILGSLRAYPVLES